MRTGNTTSCGCAQLEMSRRQIKHGGARRIGRAREYEIYSAMIDRCENPKNKVFSYYGGRGICICDRWRYGADGKTGYECFISDVGRRPSPELSIDRINNDGNYEPGNCRWATRAEQCANQRPRKRSAQ